MSNGRNYQRERNGRRFVLAGGMNLVKPPDLLTEGEYCYLQNVRRQLNGRISGRPVSGASLFTVSGTPNSIVRMNDSSPNGPLAGFVRLVGTHRMVASGLWLNGTEVAAGFSGNPLAILPFGPDQSVKPWAYVGDSSQT